MTTVTELTAEECRRLLKEHGSIRGAARATGINYSTLHKACGRHGLLGEPPASRRRKGILTREHLAAALTPPNNCAVRALLDRMDADEREVLEEALEYRKDLNAKQIIDMLVNADYVASDLPGADAFNDHRAGRRPCRCRG